MTSVPKSVSLPVGTVLAFRLTGEYDFPDEWKSPATRGLPLFRKTPVLKSMALERTSGNIFRKEVSDLASYGGEARRCFIPRHGLSFQGDAHLDVLICFECFIIWHFAGDEERRFTLSESGILHLQALFVDVGLA